MFTLKEAQQYPLLSLNAQRIHCIHHLDHKLALLGQTRKCDILTMKLYQSNCEKFPFAFDSVKIPLTRPSSKLVTNVDMPYVYKKENLFNRHNLTLDPIYAAEFTEQPTEVQPTYIAFAPNEYSLFRWPILAIVTNYGACEIMEYDPIARVYEQSKIKVNDLLDKALNRPTRVTENNIITFVSYESLKTIIDKVTVTAACWSDYLSTNEYSSLFCSTTDGTIYILNVSPKNTPELYNSVTSGLEQITTLATFKKILIASDSKGRLTSFTVTKEPHQFKEQSVLWQREDKMSSPTIKFHYNKKADRVYVLVSKGPHLLMFLLDCDGKLIEKKTHYVGNVVIVGIEHFNNSEFLVATMGGYVEHVLIHYKSDRDKFDFQTMPVKVDYDCKNFAMQGFYASPNKAVWVLLFTPLKERLTRPSTNFDDQVFISVCYMNNYDPVSKWLAMCSTHRAEDIQDLLVRIRMEIMQDKKAMDYYKYSPEPVKMDANFLNRVKLKFHIVESLGAYYRHKIRVRSLPNNNDSILYMKLLRQIVIYRRLMFLRSLKTRTPFQNLVGKCHWYTLKSLQSIQIDDDPIYDPSRPIQQTMYPIIDQLLVETENVFEKAHESCIYCKRDVLFPGLVCSGEHKFPRCCISLVQCELSSERYCPQCKHQVLDNDDLLKSVMLPDEEMNCPFCGFEFIKDWYSDEDSGEYVEDEEEKKSRLEIEANGRYTFFTSTPANDELAEQLGSVTVENELMDDYVPETIVMKEETIIDDDFD